VDNQPKQQRPVGNLGTRRKFIHVLDRRMIIPLLVIIALLIVSMGAMWLFNSSGTESVSAEVVPISAMPNLPSGPTYCKDMVRSGNFSTENTCFAELAKLNFNEDYCLGIEDIIERDVCYSDIARIIMDTNICFRLNSYTNDPGVAKCMFDIAEDTGVFETCFLIEYNIGNFSNNHCLMSLAQKNQNVGICNLLSMDEPPYDKENCIAGVDIE